MEEAKKKRERGANYTPEEKTALADLVLQYKHTIEDKRTGGMFMAKKGDMANNSHMSLQVDNVVNSDGLLQFSVPPQQSWAGTHADNISREFIIREVAFQLRLIRWRINTRGTWTDKIFFSFRKLHPNDDGLTHTIKISSDTLRIVGKEFTRDNGTWRLLHEGENNGSFDVTVRFLVTAPKVDIAPSANISPSYVKLHEDTDFTDFELRGEDGSVQVHKAVLAASSPVLRQMLSGAWRETKEGHVDVPGTSQLALQHLKGYLYLHQLPESGLEQLLLLSSYYIMPDLEKKCEDKLVRTLTAENACDRLELAVKHKMKRLMVAVLKSVQSGAIKVSDIENQLLRGASAD